MANIGPQYASFRDALFGAYISSPLMLIDSQNMTYCSITCATYIFYSCIRWRRPTRRKKVQSKVRRSVILISCCTLYSSLWIIALLHNAYVTTQFNDKVLVKDALKNFFTSKAWEETKDTWSQVWESYKEKGFGHAWQDFIAAIDPEGEAYSYKVIDINQTVIFV